MIALAMPDSQQHIRLCLQWSPAKLVWTTCEVHPKSGGRTTWSDRCARETVEGQNEEDVDCHDDDDDDDDYYYYYYYHYYCYY